MQDNPFAPPSAAVDPVVGRGMVLSAKGAAVAASLATWMRGLSIFYYLALAVVGLGSCAALVGSGGMGIGLTLGLVFLVFGAGIAVGASWLRSAARGFESGVLSDDEMTLGQGFRSLRAYLILGGLGGLASLLFQLYLASGAL